MAKKSNRELLRLATDASADLQTFGAIKSILEGSSAPRNIGQVGRHSHYAAVVKIIAICDAEIQVALKHMDAAGGELEQRATKAAKQVGANQ